MAVAAGAILFALRRPWRTGAAGTPAPARPRTARALAAHGAVVMVLALSLAALQRDATLADLVQGAVLLGVLYGVAVTDVATLQVPLAPVFLGILVRGGLTALVDRPALPATVLGLFGGAGMLALAGLAYEWIRGRPGLGHGDTAVLGLIVLPMGKEVFGWDAIFRPQGSGRTYAEMTREEKAAQSMRTLALRKLAAFLAEQRGGPRT